MSWRLTGDLDEYLALAGAFLAARPVEHTVLLTVTETLRERGALAFGDEPPLFGWWVERGGVAGACLQTPPYPLMVSELPERAVPALAEALADRPLPGVNGKASVAQAFADARGGPATVKRRELLYRLGSLTPPPSPPGRAVPAGDVPRALLVDWMAAFQVEIGESPETAARHVENRLDGLRVWVVDGHPVSLAAVSAPLAGMARVGPVYTPPAHRGRGYGGALTAVVSQNALDAGAEAVLLFADVANEVSNRIYRRLGFEPLQERLVLDFH